MVNPDSKSDEIGFDLQKQIGLRGDILSNAENFKLEIKSLIYNLQYIWNGTHFHFNFIYRQP